MNGASWPRIQTRNQMLRERFCGVAPDLRANGLYSFEGGKQEEQTLAILRKRDVLGVDVCHEEPTGREALRAQAAWEGRQR